MILASVIIPTKNEEKSIGECLERVYHQSVDFAFEVLVMDSGSQDHTLQIVEKYPAQVEQIRAGEFHHARTRNLGALKSSGKYLVFLSGDAIPADSHWLSGLLKNFAAPQIAAVYGRQLPNADATPERAYFLQHRYGTKRLVRTAGRGVLGKHLLYQFSNVNSAIRREVWKRFPFAEDLNAYEDFSFAVQALQHGYSIAYEPEAAVFHSHNYSMWRSFQQYFDSGVLYRRRELWDPRQRRRMRSDGIRYLWKEIEYLVNHGVGHRVPYVVCYEAMRYLGLFLGRNENLLPDAIKKRTSSHRLFG